MTGKPALVVATVAIVAGCAGTSVSRPGPPRQLVSGATWSHTPEGYRLHVRPNLQGRLSGAVDTTTMLSESLQAAAPTPIALTHSIRSSLEDQLRCHAVFAPHKSLWNLESWRPNVGYARVVLHACNP
jgi:hypothetical protein